MVTHLPTNDVSPRTNGWQGMAWFSQLILGLHLGCFVKLSLDDGSAAEGHCLKWLLHTSTTQWLQFHLRQTLLNSWILPTVGMPQFGIIYNAPQMARNLWSDKRPKSERFSCALAARVAKISSSLFCLVAEGQEPACVSENGTMKYIYIYVCMYIYIY